jgi:P4 family phage/plasmid primase-like protien
MESLQTQIEKYLNEKGLSFKSSNGQFELDDCPFSGCGKGHFYISMETGQFMCQKCGQAGNLVTLKKHFGDDLISSESSDWGIGTASLADMARAFHRDLLNSSEAIQYLAKRHITIESIKKFGLGYDSVGRRIAIPYWEGSECKLIKYRSVVNNRKGREKGHPSPLYNLARAKQFSGAVIITEGELDSVSVEQMGFPNVVSISCGADTFKDEWVEELKGFSKKYLWYDNDLPGKEGAVKAASKIGFDQCLIVHCEEFKDANECLKHGWSQSEVTKLLAEAKPVSAAEVMLVIQGDDDDDGIDKDFEAQAFLESSRFIFIYEQIREYQDGWYQVRGERELLERIRDRVSGRYEVHVGQLKEILELVKIRLSATPPKVNDDPLFICCKNGLMDLRTFTLFPHDPDKVFLYQVNASFHDEMECRDFIKFLETILVNEDLQPDQELIDLLQEFLGYILFVGEIPFHCAAIFLGPGSNGKSVLINVIERILAWIVSHVPLQQIGVDRFASADLVGSVLNVSPEIGRDDKLSEQVKAILAGDMMMHQRKFEHPFNARVTAKHIITANHLPQATDTSFGFFRRFLIFRFRKVFLFEYEKTLRVDCEARGIPYQEADGFIEKTLATEIDGIFVWMLRGLVRLLNRGAFPSCESSDREMQHFKSRSQTVEDFAKKYLPASSPDKVSLETAYSQYARYCRANDYYPASTRKFAERLRKESFHIERGTEGATFIYGTKLLDDNIR